ncbi:hypothetical protein VLK31_34945 [Variovorax sp. H27-G14]|uniref:hypothetical protein n=1 Tax=Variovorax sp. H27-G14 TaxID=3111914 RepID=UPI0038FD2F19
MPIVRIGPAGQYGINADVSQHELPPNVWTGSNNIRFIDGSAAQFYGYGEAYAGTPVVPLHVLPVTVAGVRGWIYASDKKIYLVQGTTHTNITRQTSSVDVDYTATRNAWTSTVLGGVPILNNGIDPPQQWLLTGKASVLSAWPANTTCAVMRAYKNSLIALDVTKAGVRYPYMVKWSHPADPGTVPVTWDPADITKEAGEFDLSEGYDYIVDALPLRSSLVVYKESSVWRLDYVGGTFIYNASKVLGTSGALNRNCIVEIDGMHFVLTGSDVVVHDGQQATSVLDKQARRFLFRSIDSQLTGRCFVFKNPYFNEVYVCYPQAGDSSITRAMVWNWVDKTVTFRDMPNINHAAHGSVDADSQQSWDSDTNSWDSDITAWNAPANTPDRARVLMASDDQKLYLLDASANFGLNAPTSWLERRGLSFDAPQNMKTIRGIRPRISGTTGQTVMVSVGHSSEASAEPVYQPAVPFVIGSGVSADLFDTGRYMAIKFSSGTALQWKLDSFDVDVMQAGSW